MSEFAGAQYSSRLLFLIGARSSSQNLTILRERGVPFKRCLHPPYSVSASGQFSFQALKDGPVNIAVKIDDLCGYNERFFQFLVADGHFSVLFRPVPYHDAGAFVLVFEEGGPHWL